MGTEMPGATRTSTRRAFVAKGMAVGVAATAGGLLERVGPAAAEEVDGSLTAGDAAILRFLAALETLETDLWQQYNELGGIQDAEVPGGSGNLMQMAPSSPGPQP